MEVKKGSGGLINDSGIRNSQELEVILEEKCGEPVSIAGRGLYPFATILRIYQIAAHYNMDLRENPVYYPSYQQRVKANTPAGAVKRKTYKKKK